jgi:amino acid adenylation domain-containing protein/non-ribosomal peptide synthase protein (TIGR01720 family)/FkbM family methyltransferase
LSPQQERWWSLRRIDQSPAYQARCAVSIDGDFDAARFAQAIRAVVARHEILRTTFAHMPGLSVPVQVVGDCEPTDSVEFDLSGLDPAEQARRIDELYDGMAKEPFDLERGPVFRLRLVTLSPERRMFFLSLPSVSADAASIRNLAREICAYYSEGPDDREIIQYAELAEWQNQLLEAEETSVGRRYWAGKEIPDAFDARPPFERPAAQAAFDPEQFDFTLPADLTAKVDDIAAGQATSAGIVLLACWQALLGKLTGSQEVVVGSLYDGRKFEELADALGPFERYLPAPARVEEARSFSALVSEIHEEDAELYGHQEFFSWRDLKHNVSPVFSFCFSYDETPGDETSGDETPGGAKFSIVRQGGYAERFKLQLSAVRENDRLRLAIHFDKGLFRLADIRRLSEQFAALLENALAAPSSPIGALECLGESERRRLLVEFNDTAAVFQTGPCVHEVIREQAFKYPDRPALSFEGESLTYAELNAEANRIARLLRQLGVTTDSRVAILLDRCAGAIVSLLGVLKAGGAYVPLDTGSPKDRLAGMLEDAGVAVVITQSGLLGLVPSSDIKTICIDGDRGAIEGQSGEDLPDQAGPDSLAYVIYTSGSTGRPKGVAVEHRQLSNYVNSVAERLDLPPAASYATVSTLAADLGNTMIFPALCAGGHLHVIGQERVSNADALAEYFAKNRIDCLKIVPSHLEALLTSPRAEDVIPRARLVLGGEASRWGLIEKVRALAPRCKIFNHYGPTETTVGVLTCAAQPGADGRESAAVPLGRPLANVRVYLLNSYRRPVPAGVAGEVYVGGSCVARGYINRPELTAERFTPDPFSSEPGARLYRTGDLARSLSDGSLEFLGRVDDQVKIRGFRIELGEIEAALRQHPGVDDAIVLPRADGAGNRRLVAYVAPGRKHRRTIEGRVRHQLPNRMEIAHLNRNETDYGFREIFERESYFRHGVSLDEGACVLDVGANIGMFSLFVSERFPDARIYAYEPVGAIYDVLRLNAELYGPNVRAHNLGLSAAPGTAQFTYFPGYSVMSGLSAYSDAEGEKRTLKTILRNREGAGESASLLDHADELLDGRFAGQTVQCRLTTISEIIEREAIERVNLLKIDAQKAEADVLAGIRPGDWEKIDQIVMETHDQTGEQTEGRVERVVGLLKERGYRVTVEQEEEFRGTDRHTVYALRGERRPQAKAATAPGQVARPESSILEADDLGRFLEQKLPDYMIPSNIVLLDALPLNANGKVDRNALPSPEEADRGSGPDFNPPKTEVEKALAKIWAGALGLDRVGINDNFFKLGGDSIISIQIVVKANQAGIRLTPRQFFQHQTIAELAAVANEAGAVDAEQGPIAGPAPLTPIQHWFFEGRPVDPHFWNMALLLESRRTLDSAVLNRAAQTLLVHHDALRLRFTPGESGWSQTNGAPDDFSPLTQVDLSELPTGAESEAIEGASAQIQASLDLGRGPLMRLAHFSFSGDRAARLLLVIHHLAVDGVSWRILLEDLQAAYQGLSANGEGRLPLKSTSFKRWAERLPEYAGSDGLRKEAEYWLGLPWREVAPLPVDAITAVNSAGARASNTVGASRAVTVSLTAAETQSLMQSVPEAYNTQINDALLAALAQALRRWTGRRVHLIDLEGHGREEILEGVDLTRTVGCFTTRLPVPLEACAADDVGEQLRSVKELLRRIPQKGIGYGILRYLSKDARLSEELRGLPQPEISFNYLGQLDQVLTEDSPFAPARESAGPLRSPRAARRYLIEVSGRVIGGRLEMIWRYAEGAHHRSTVERLAGWFIESMRSTIDHCLSAGAGGFTASDFAEFGWDENDLQQILGKISEAA